MLLYAKRWQNDCIFASKRIDLHNIKKRQLWDKQQLLFGWTLT